MSFRRTLLFRRWTHEVSPIFGLAFPIMSGMVAQILMGLADTVMVGRIGVVPLAAAAFVNTVAHLPLICTLGMLSSIAVLTSQAHGKRDSAGAGEILRHGLVISAGMGLLAAGSVILIRPFLPWFGQPPEVVDASGTYLVLFGLSIAPAILAHGCKQFSEALNRPWQPTWILLGGVLLNIFLNWVLIYGNWGAPALGLNGAGWATLMARVVMGFGLLAYVVGAPALRSSQPHRWMARLSKERFRSLFQLGWPVAAQHSFEVSAFAFAALMMGWISAEAMAAHQIAITCAATTFMFALGIGMAACIRVGQAWGAGQFKRMRRIGFVAMGSSALLMGGFASVLMLAGTPIANLFVTSPAVVQLAAQLLLIAAIFQVADGIQVTALSALRGLSDVRVPVLIAILSYWMIAVPLGYILAFPLLQGAVGIWIGLALGLGIAALILLWRFHRMSGSTQKVVAEPELNAAL